MVDETKKEAVKETSKETAVKVNPIAKEATAKKADPLPSKIEDSKKETALRKEKDAARKPTHDDLMKSMQKQTARRMKDQENALKLKTKPKSFPPLVK